MVVKVDPVGKLVAAHHGRYAIQEAIFRSHGASIHLSTLLAPYRGSSAGTKRHACLVLILPSTVLAFNAS